MKVAKVGEDKGFQHLWWFLIVNSVFAFLIFDLGVLLFVVFNYNVKPCCKFFLNMHLWSSKGVRSYFYFPIFSNYCAYSFAYLFIYFVNLHQAMKINLGFAPHPFNFYSHTWSYANGEWPSRIYSLNPKP
jgi:hypothetical protein